MEKFIFLATIKDKLTEMNLPKEIVNKHVKVFEDCFRGKGASEVDKVINGAGGIDGILLSIYNLENAKQKDNNYICPVKESPDIPQTNEEQSPTEDNSINTSNPSDSLKKGAALTATIVKNTMNNKPASNDTTDATDSATLSETEDSINQGDTIAIPVVTSVSTENNTENVCETTETVDKSTADESSTVNPESDSVETTSENKEDADKNNNDSDNNVDLNEIFTSSDEEPKEVEETNSSEEDPPTIEIPKTSEITEHIKEAEKITETLERIPIPTDKNEEEFPSELSDYDFDKLFEEKLSKPESWAKKLRSKMSPKVFWCTLPIPIILFAVIFTVVLALIPILIASGIACAAAYIVVLVVGVCFSVIPIGYGIFMCFNSMPIAFYELGIGITSTGATMFAGIILYNYFKRLVPYLIKKVIKLFKLCFRVAKRYFKKPVKEVE